MPTYDYVCPNGHQWEEQRPMAERNEDIACPECGEIGRRIFISTPVIPWYPGCNRSPYKEKRRHE
ncbi:MAG: hypothetical protein JRC93_13640 [Deltaproteobacteria bacterium]|nr:hypothetical protein [Deltaproteobacteria bacterium]